MNNNEPDDKVGYKNPPKSGQFKKGQSGNPSGRPRKPKRFETSLNQIFYRDKLVNLNGRKVNLTGMDMVLMKLRDMAIKGDIQATRLLLPILEMHGTYNDWDGIWGDEGEEII